MDTKELVPGTSHRVLLGFDSYAFIHLNLEGNEWWGTKKGIKIWIERLIIKSAGELSSWGT